METLLEATSTPSVRLDDLVAKHQVGLWRYLRYLGCEPDLAEDLVQQTFVTAWERPFEVRNPAATAAWLRTVARNHFLMAVRRERLRPAFTDIERAEAAWAERTAGNDGSELLDALRACLATLADRARRALDVFYAGTRSRRRVADALDITEDGAKTLLRRAREHLRACIRRRLT